MDKFIQVKVGRRTFYPGGKIVRMLNQINKYGCPAFELSSRYVK